MCSRQFLNYNNYVINSMKKNLNILNVEKIYSNENSIRWISKCQRFSVVKPGNVSAPRVVPKHIKIPDYKNLTQNSTRIPIKTRRQIDGIREACTLARKILNQCFETVKVGVTADEIDVMIHDSIIKHNAYPSPLHYKGYPKSVCTSVNNVVCHGIPDDRPLVDGDIVNVDVTVYYKGYHGDCSETFDVGDVDEVGRKLISTTRKCLTAAINVCKPGQAFRKIGKTINELALIDNFNVIPDFCGHGIGESFHEPPNIIHIENDFPGIMKPGMVFTIEPILSEGGTDMEILEDGWTAVTTDDSRTAQCEHTVLITESGVEILTSR